MARYLVTGGAGFIGSHIVDALIEAGHEVRIIDNFSTGKRENLNARAELFERDITDMESIRPVFDGVDGVFHVAALPRIPLSIAEPQKTNAVHVTGTLNVLVAARDAKVRRVVYSASSSAYGNQEHMPVVETMRPMPANPYGLQKFVGEQYMEVFHKVYGLETVSLRYFNVYGPRMADTGAYVSVMSTFLRQRAAGQPLTITGDGEQTRDFTHVSDVVQANVLAMNSPKSGKGEVINAGAGGSITINALAALFGGPVAHIDPRPGEIRHSQADTARARELLGWEPKIALKDGVAELLR